MPQIKKEWSLEDRSTWVVSFDPANREEVRRAMQQAREMHETLRDHLDNPFPREAAVKHFNRIKKYWDKVK